MTKQKKNKKKQGRPSDFSPDICDLICQLLVEGNSLRAIARREDMPSIATVYKWFRDYPEFLKQYEQARLDQIDTFADEIIDIADNPKAEPKSVQRDRLRIDARKWLAERMRPTKYGTKVDPESNRPVVMMGRITIDGKDLDLDIGEPVKKKYERTRNEASDKIASSIN